MAYFDLPLDALQTYRPPRQEPADFDAFWKQSLEEAQSYPLDASFTPVDYGLRTVEVLDVSFNGYAGQAIKGWLLLPGERRERLPAVVEYTGYGGGRGFPTDWLVWSSAGYAHLVMDTRGQGSAWRNGDTPDWELEGSPPHFPGFMTRGVLSPDTYYYRRLITDAVRAVEAVGTHPAVDRGHIAVTGGSQGGGLALAAGGLSPEVQAVMPDVPFLCHYRRAVDVTDALPYAEIASYCKARRSEVGRVFETLSYFDGVNFAARAHAPALFSVGLMDEVCPPSTVFAAYNEYGGPKEMRIYPFNHHEGGDNYQVIEQLRWLAGLWEG